jgi:UDP-N-acetylglucosamine 1-carboxyvinyltransferase
MDKLIIKGGISLKGEIKISGAKNAVLPILAATILNGKINVIKNCPKLKDVDITLKILEELGCNVKREGDTIIVDSSSINHHEIPENLVVEMRSSIFFLGPMLSRFGEVTISYPGE